MKILVSACLLGENCKYSGGNNYNQAVCDFARGHQVVPVCPEVLGGLPTRGARRKSCRALSRTKRASMWTGSSEQAQPKALAIAKEKMGWSLPSCNPAVPVAA